MPWESISLVRISFPKKGGFVVHFLPEDQCRCGPPDRKGKNSTVWFIPLLKILTNRAKNSLTRKVPISCAELRNTYSFLENVSIERIERAFSASLCQGTRYFQVLEPPAALAHLSAKEAKPKIGEILLSQGFDVTGKPGHRFLRCMLIPPKKPSPPTSQGPSQESKRKSASPRFSPADHARAREEYFRRGNNEQHVKARRVLYCRENGKPVPKQHPSIEEAVGTTCCFLDEAGRSVEDGYLLLSVFDSPSGDMVARMLRLCAPEICKYRGDQSQRYAMFHARLVGMILEAGYLKAWNSSERAEVRELVKKFSSPSPSIEDQQRQATKGRKRTIGKSARPRKSR